MMKRIMDGLSISWAIALKDVQDVFKNRGTRTNVLVLVGLVVFFYWMGTLRPFDKVDEVVILNESVTDLSFEKTQLEDGSELEFRQADSFVEFEQKMTYQDLGIILPDNFDQQLISDGELTLSGYIHWAKRKQVAELENLYSEKFSELLGTPTRIMIGENILLPSVNALGMASTAAFHVFFAIVFMALTVVPFLMFEERQSKTIDALLVSPASPGLVVLGKALAGMILVTAIAGFSIALNGIYVIHWSWAIVGFFFTAVFSIGLALFLGSFVRAPQQITLWMLPVVFLVVVPGFFADEPNLTPAAKSVINWLPGVPFNRILGLSVSNGSNTGMIGTNLALAMFAITVVYALVVWRVRRSDR